MNLSSVVGQIFVEILCLCGGIVLGAGLLVQPILLSPVYAVRYLAQVLARRYRPDLGKILSTGSALLALDDRHKKPKASVLFCFIFDGELDHEGLARHILKEVVGARTAQGELCYPELRQYITSWLGFYFWANDESFEIRNHVQIHTSQTLGGKSEVDEAGLSQLASSWLSKPYHRTRSPWTFLLIPNFVSKGHSRGSKQTALAFRFHHALSDAFSLYKLLDKMWDRPVLSIPVRGPEPKKSLARSLLRGISLSVLTPYRIVKMVWDCMDWNQWHLNRISYEAEGALVPKVPMSVLKEIQRSYGVSSLNAVVFAAYAGALRRMMLDRGLKVPRSVHTLTPLPVPGHPQDKLRNHAGAGFVELPVGTVDPAARLKAIDTNVKNLMADPTPMLLFRGRPLTAGLFNWMLKPLPSSRFLISTAYASSFPGPKTPVQLLGLNCTDQHFTFGFLAGIGMTTLSYNGNIRFCISLDKTLLAKIPNPDMDNIASMILEELEVLRKGTIV